MKIIIIPFSVYAGEAAPSLPCKGSDMFLPPELHERIMEAETVAGKGDYAAATELVESYLTAHPDEKNAYCSYDLGFFRYSAGDPEAAVKHLKKAVKTSPCFTEAWQLLALSSRQAGDAVTAAQSMERAADLTGDRGLKYQAAVIWLEAEKPDKALALLQGLADQPSPRPEWLVAQARAFGALKKKVETAQAMERAARTANDASLMYQAAWLWLEADRADNALALLEILAGRNDPEIDWLLLLCNTRMILGHNLEAATVMDRVIERSPLPDHLYNGGLLWLQVEKPVKALPHLLALALKENPEADWFVALSQAFILSGNLPDAAAAMERAFGISKEPAHAYQAGLLRLQLEEADRALTLLAPLGRHQDPEAAWLSALSNAWILKENYGNAADAMERAAVISKRDDDTFRAAQLRLQAEEPHRALPLLTGLSKKPSPKQDWLVSLSGTFQLLDRIPEAAGAIERAAEISGKADHYHDAALLRQQSGARDRTRLLLEKAVSLEPLNQAWRVELAALLLELKRPADALTVMGKTRLQNPSTDPELGYRGAVVWLDLDRSEKALPILETLSRHSSPKEAWLTSLVIVSMEAGNTLRGEEVLEQLLDAFPGSVDAWNLAVWAATRAGDYARAAAATDVAARLDPSDTGRLRELSAYYHMAGVPVKAAAVFRKAVGADLLPEDWDRLRDIYLSGKLYALALEPSQEAVFASPSAPRWESLGDILFMLRRFKESGDAYREAASLSPSASLHLKAGYAFLKDENLKQAAEDFQAVLDQTDGDDDKARDAIQSLTYIRSINSRSVNSPAQERP